MMLKALPFAIFALTSSALPPSLAWADDAPHYTMEDVTACSKDALRLCKDKLTDLSATEECMRSNFNQLSPKCRARFHRNP